MQPDTAAPAVTHVSRRSPHDSATPPPEPPRRRWRRWSRPGTAFLDRPAGDAYANRWQAACGQGG